jgi:hypothetical protein
MFNPIKWFKNLLAKRRYKKKIAERLKKLREEDPYIYD